MRAKFEALRQAYEDVASCRCYESETVWLTLFISSLYNWCLFKFLGQVSYVESLESLWMRTVQVIVKVPWPWWWRHSLVT
jgi:hypothetical protein